MDKLLTVIPGWAFGIGFIIILICFLYLVIKDRIRMRNKWFSIESKRFNPEAFLLVFKENLRVQRKIDKIEDKLRMSEQMSFVEDEVKNIYEEIIRVHRHILQHKGISQSDSENHSQIKIMSLIVENMINQMKGSVRERFREMCDLFDIEENTNDNFDFIKADFEKYYQRVSDAIIQDSRSCVRERWVDNENIKIGRRESWDSIQEALSENGKIGKILREIFQNAICVQLKYSKEIKKLEKQIDSYIKRIINEI